MMPHLNFWLLAVFTSIFSLSTATTTYEVNGNCYQVNTVISRDVSIIGGGSAGTYSAIRLRDSGKGVLMVEKSGRLGGNTETYIDPVTGAPLDFGVQIFHKFNEVYDYFSRLNIPLINTSASLSGVHEYVDFHTGKLNTSYSWGDYSKAFAEYGAQVAKYPYLDRGFNLTYPVPADLLIPFGDFAKKYSLDLAVPLIWKFTQGIGDLLRTPTIYVMKYLGLSSLASIQNGFLTTAGYHNSLLYESAERILGQDVLYNGTILEVERGQDGVAIIVKTPSQIILIKSQKLIIAIQPTLQNLKPFDLSDCEKKLFGKFTSTEYFSGVLRNSGIPSNISLVNIDAGQPFYLPPPPALYGITQTEIPNLSLAYYLSTTTTKDDEIAQKILSDVKKLQMPGKEATNPEFAVTGLHRPFELKVSAVEIENGFYRELYGLQGESRTWYASATFHAHDSSLIWRFVEELLPSILA